MKLTHLIFVLSLPILGALGHDAYLFYQNQADGFALTSFGFVMTEYFRDEVGQVREALDPDTWSFLLKHIFPKKTVTIAAIPLIIGVPVWCIFRAVRMMIGASD